MLFGRRLKDPRPNNPRPPRRPSPPPNPPVPPAPPPATHENDIPIIHNKNNSSSSSTVMSSHNNNNNMIDENNNANNAAVVLEDSNSMMNPAIHTNDHNNANQDQQRDRNAYRQMLMSRMVYYLKSKICHAFCVPTSSPTTL